MDTPTDTVSDSTTGAASDSESELATLMRERTTDWLRDNGSLKWTAGPADAIGAFVAESDLPLAPAIKDVLRAGIDRELTGYLPDHLTAQVGAALAGFQQARFGWSADPAFVRLTPDVLTALTLTARYLMPASTPIVLPTPAYMPFLDAGVLAERELRTVPMDVVDGRCVVDPERLASALEGGGLLVLVNPHNPTGQVAGRDELLAVAEVVEHTGSTVFADEIHSPVVFPGAHHLPYASLSEATAAHSVTAVSASKGWNVPGLTCAQLILTAQRHRELWERAPFAAKHGPSPLGALAAIAAYTDGVVHLDTTVEYLDAARTLFARELALALPDVEYRVPQATYLHWLDLRPLRVDPAAVAGRTGVLGVDGIKCGAPGFLRLALGTSHEIIAETARRLGRLAGGE